jgi:hypothetical protein
MRQKIAELGMAANQVPGMIDWEIIPDVSIYDNPMDVDAHLDEWEDIFEEDSGIEGQSIGQTLVQQARLQTIITCSCLLFPTISYP